MKTRKKAPAVGPGADGGSAVPGGSGSWVVETHEVRRYGQRVAADSEEAGITD